MTEDKEKFTEVIVIMLENTSSYILKQLLLSLLLFYKY